MESDSSEALGQVLGIGDHCSVDHCRQIDFLPFKCDCCSRVFCLEHRSYAAHACPKAGAKETTVIVCPLCAKSVRLEPGQDANSAFDAHQRSDCDPANYDRVHKKPRCPVGGCKERLTTINAYRCKHCSQRICLRHRDPGDHGCAEAQAALRQQRGFAFGAALGTGKASSSGQTSGNASAASSRPPSAPRATGGATAAPAATSAPAAARRLNPQQLHAEAQRQYEDPSNSVRGTAERRIALMQQQQQAEQQRRQQQQQGPRWPWQQAPPAPASQPPAPPPPQPAPQAHQRPPTGISAPANNANPLVPPHLPERCPQCGAAFATVERLIQHVEDFHPSSPATAGGGGAGGTYGVYGAPTSDAGPGPGHAGESAGGMFANPLRGLLSSATTIAGGAAPTVAPTAGPGAGGGGGYGSGAGGAPAAGREVFRCYHCARTFNDPVLLVQHSDRCGAAARGGAGQGRISSGGGAGASKDACVLS